MIKLFQKFEHLPIRTKMTVWFSISFIAVMAFFFTSFYIVTQSTLLTKIDNSLKNQTTEIVNLLENQTISPSSKELILKSFNITKTSLVLIFNSDFQIVAQSQSFPIDINLLSLLINDVQENQTPHFFTQEKTRFYIYPLISNNTLVGTIIVGDSISVINDAFSALINTLLVVFLLFLLPLILMSSLQTNILLEPLRDLAKTMNTITTKNLSSRVNILNPKDEIGEVSTAFNRLLDRLQKGLVKERQLIHDVSHQLKTPLTAMQSDLEIGLSKPRDKSIYKDILENVLLDTTRMANLLKDMMNFAWASSDNQDKSFKKHNLSHIIEEISEIVQHLALKKNLIVETSILHDMYIKGQREKILQIYLNILENAVKYSPNNSKIYIKAYYDNNSAKVLIKDQGIGISKKDLPHIFERFYRGNSSEEGSGLGLSITAALVKAHKGKIEVTSQKNRGTNFIVSLPCIQYDQKGSPIFEKITKTQNKQDKKAKKPFGMFLTQHLKPHPQKLMNKSS
jgi:two-component system sensor histidine kinase ArlS